MTTIEFCGSFWGALIGFVIIWLAIYLNEWASKQKDKYIQAMSIMLVCVAIVIFGTFHYEYPERVEAKEAGRLEALGMPISIIPEGSVFVPRAFVITDQHTLIYNKDGKVYDLVNIHLEKGLTTESLDIGTNVTYTVFRRGQQLLLGKL